MVDYVNRTIDVDGGAAQVDFTLGPDNTDSLHLDGRDVSVFLDKDDTPGWVNLTISTSFYDSVSEDYIEAFALLLLDDDGVARLKEFLNELA